MNGTLDLVWGWRAVLWPRGVSQPAALATAAALLAVTASAPADAALVSWAFTAELEAAPAGWDSVTGDGTLTGIITFDPLDPLSRSSAGLTSFYGVVEEITFTAGDGLAGSWNAAGGGLHTLAGGLPTNFVAFLEEPAGSRTLKVDLSSNNYAGGAGPGSTRPVRMRLGLTDSADNNAGLEMPSGPVMPPMLPPDLSALGADDVRFLRIDFGSTATPRAAVESLHYKLSAISLREPVTGVAVLTSGSPAGLETSVDTGATPFSINFDYRFETTTGTLTVLLAGQDISGPIAAPATLTDPFSTLSLLIDDATLANLTDAVLQFVVDGPAGSQVLIDNVVVAGLDNGDFERGFDGWRVSAGNQGTVAFATVIEAGEVAAVPSPHAMILFGFGLIGLAGFVAGRTTVPAAAVAARR